MNSMRLRPPRPPKERASRVRQTTEMLCTAEKVSIFGAKAVNQQIQLIFLFFFPLFLLKKEVGFGATPHYIF